MKIIECVDIINSHLFSENIYLSNAWEDISNAIQLTDWPHNTGRFLIFPEKKGNGVKPIKVPCINYLNSKGWLIEALPDIGSTVLDTGKTGDLDALKKTPDGYIAFEWETGNISSSHRAINKLLLTMQETKTLGSFLVVPSNSLKVYLTDRIGNIGELKPYMPLWRNIPAISGAFRIVVVEHDETSIEIPKIPKGKDGRAKK